MTDTPRVNALESNPLDSFDFRAWKTLARELERELIWASGEKAKLTEIVAARPEVDATAAFDAWMAAWPGFREAASGTELSNLRTAFGAGIRAALSPLDAQFKEKP